MNNIKTVETTADKIPIGLLLQADPNEASVRSYIDSGLVFAALEYDSVIGVCVVVFLSDTKVELFNVSVSEGYQQQGIGTELLRFVLQALRLKGVTQVELGTGTFGYQLTFYQRLGFRVGAVNKDYFVHRYPEPIYENGIHLRDQLRLYLELA